MLMSPQSFHVSLSFNWTLDHEPSSRRNCACFRVAGAPPRRLVPEARRGAGRVARPLVVAPAARLLREGRADRPGTHHDGARARVVALDLPGVGEPAVGLQLVPGGIHEDRVGGDDVDLTGPGGVAGE